jgi:Cdc6-like AAA superfamily ATPase
MSGGFFRLLGALVKPLMLVYRWWRPVADRASIAVLSDELSAAVQRSEQRLQRALRASGHDLMQVEFITTARLAGDAGRVAVADIATYFELLGHPEPHRRRVVVLGAPGSGKTVAATYMVLGLLKTRQNLEDAPRANEPVPVRVNAAGWDGQRDFTRWLIVRLGHDYRLRPNVAREMVERGLIQPVIDGLDEMDTGDSAGSRARALLDRLNRAPWRDRPVIVMCRTTEFAELTQLRGDNGLHGGTTVTLQPLDTDTVDKYLSAHQDETWTGHPGWTRAVCGTTVPPRSSTGPARAACSALTAPPTSSGTRPTSNGPSNHIPANRAYPRPPAPTSERNSLCRKTMHLWT